MAGSRLDAAELVREIGPLNPNVAVKARGNTMPYASVDDLPAAVQKLDPDKQKQWLAVFNKAYEDKGEEAAFRIAWGVVNASEPLPEAGHG